MLPDTDPDEVYWRERISQEILGEMMAYDADWRLRPMRKRHPREEQGRAEAAQIALEGL